MGPSLLSLEKEGGFSVRVSRCGLFGPLSSESIGPSVQRLLLPFWSCANLKTGCRCIKARHHSPCDCKECCTEAWPGIDDLFA